MTNCARQNIAVIRRNCWFLFAVLSFLAASACNQQKGLGVLEVQIKDHRDAIGDFASADIIVESIRLSPKVGFRFWQLGWKNLNPNVERVDLTQYTGRSAATIFKGNVEAGSFEALDLKLRRIESVLKKSSAPVAVSNKLAPFALSFVLNPDEVIRIVLDLSVMDMSDHPPEAYELQLVGYETYRNGKLIDKIPRG
jgi:hypothetical protein